MKKSEVREETRKKMDQHCGRKFKREVVLMEE